jgi:hypothetical protein
MLIAVTAGIIISSINSKGKTTDINILPFIIPVMALALGAGLYRGVNRQRALFESYTLTLTNNLITREQLNTPAISIYFNDIKEIAKNSKGEFTVKGKDATDIIIVPVQIENHHHLENALALIRSITTKSKAPFLEKYRTLLSLLTMGLMLCVYAVTNKVLVTLSGTLFIGIMLWGLIEIQKNKNIDNKTKRNSWVVLIVIISVIAVMVMKLSGVQKK